MEKRKLAFDSFDQVIDEIERLRSRGYTPQGQWNLSQVCEHLTRTMRAGMDGGLKLMPWILRATILRFMANRIINSGNMPSGFTAPSESVPPDHKEDDPAKIDKCIATLRETAAFAGPLPPHPFSTGMTLEKWKRLMQVHAAHHLGFLQPAQ
ncbi:MAG: DUF1569 domain-containing protein [Planctomycetales bacterium]|nr:DUF1569 domain-containing protein [Planctomycetales bacterium]